MRDGLHLVAEMVEGFDEKAASACRRIEHAFTKPRVYDLNHESHDSTWCVEFT